MPAEVAELVRQYEGGADMKVLAARWGSHRTTMAGHLRRTGVALRRQGAVAAWQESVMPLGSGYALSGTGYLDGLSVAAIAQKVADATVAAVTDELDESATSTP